jgi:hypothetical protein
LIGRTERLLLLFLAKQQAMFGLFKKKDPREAIMERYKAMLAESHRLSTIDRKASDLKRAEAEALLDELDKETPKA